MAKDDQSNAGLSGAWFMAAMEHSPIGMALVGLDGRWLWTNQALQDTLGYEREELERLSFQDITGLPDTTRYNPFIYDPAKLIGIAAKNGRPVTNIYPYSRDGRLLLDVRLYDQLGRPLDLLGRDPTPADGIGPDELKTWFADKEEPSAGSVFLVRTGWMRYFADADRYLGLKTGLPGVTRAGAEWLSDRGILACGSDTMNYEHKPDPAVTSLTVHIHNLVDKGIFIMESMNLEELAAAEAYDFTFLALPLRIRGGTGSPIRPVAIVTR